MANVRSLKLTINGIPTEVAEGTTLLEAIRNLGIEIPTLCYRDSLSPQGACRLCCVEIGPPGRTKLVSSCTYPCEEGLIVRTHSKRVVKARKILVELLLSIAPQSKTIQDLASNLGVSKVRFKITPKDCIQCGLCVRMCAEQMMAKAISYEGRGYYRKITTPFDITSEECRRCGGCMFVCPVIQIRCQGPISEPAICNACYNLQPTCLDVAEDQLCYMGSINECGQCTGREEKK